MPSPAAFRGHSGTGPAGHPHTSAAAGVLCGPQMRSSRTARKLFVQIVTSGGGEKSSAWSLAKAQWSPGHAKTIRRPALRQPAERIKTYMEPHAPRVFGIPRRKHPLSVSCGAVRVRGAALDAGTLQAAHTSLGRGSGGGSIRSAATFRPTERGWRTSRFTRLQSGISAGPTWRSPSCRGYTPSRRGAPPGRGHAASTSSPIGRCVKWTSRSTEHSRTGCSAPVLQ